jgi:hypothetical protein
VRHSLQRTNAVVVESPTKQFDERLDVSSPHIFTLHGHKQTAGETNTQPPHSIEHMHSAMFASLAVLVIAGSATAQHTGGNNTCCSLNTATCKPPIHSQPLPHPTLQDAIKPACSALACSPFATSPKTPHKFSQTPSVCHCCAHRVHPTHGARPLLHAHPTPLPVHVYSCACARL